MLVLSGMTFAQPTEASENVVTRGDFIRALVGAMDTKLGDGSSISFEDVNKDLAPYVEKAFKLNLVKGKTAEQFAPDEKLNREQAFVIALRGLGTDKVYAASIIERFKDQHLISKSLKPEFINAVGTGLIKGYSDGTIKPQKLITQTEMKRIIERFLSEYSPSEANTTVALRILGTTDLHTNLANYDYYQDKPSNSLGFAKTATLIKEAREENPNSLLFDNGDLIQGTPLGSFKVSVEPLAEGEVHPVFKAMGLLDYDAATLGNHEFNYGLPYLERVLEGAPFPYVNANVLDADTGENYFTPYIMLDKKVIDSNGEEQSVKVGVTGVVTPQIMQWDKAHLEGKVTTYDAAHAVEKIIPEMKKQGADVIVVIAHSGMGDETHDVGEADVTYQITELDGVNAVITGHNHAVFPGDFGDLENVDMEQGTVNGVPVVMPGKFGSHLGVIDLKLAEENANWTVVDGKAAVREISKDDSDVDEAVMEAIKAEHEGTISYVRQPVGETTADIHSYFSQVQDDPSIQIVTNAQKWYVENQLKGTEDEALPVLSAGAPFKAGTRDDPEYYSYIPKGELAIKNVADLYVYDNTIATLKLTGADVKEWLEMSAGQFNQIDSDKTAEQSLINTNYRSYNFDVIDGVTYEIDVTQPAKYDTNGNTVNENAERIKNLSYDGQPIDEEQVFIVATNNYRASGNFPGVRNAIATELYQDENRQAIIDYILDLKTIDPSADGNWVLSPLPEGANVFFESSMNGADLIPADSSIQYVGEGAGGFGKYTLK